MKTAVSIVIVLGFFSLLYFAGCSKKITTYDDLESAGTLEQTAKKDHADFFAAVDRIGKATPSADGTIDSTLIQQAAKQTDTMVEAIREFPSMVGSRVAYDAISFAAVTLLNSPNIANPQVNAFWKTGLLVPLLGAAKQYVSANVPLESAHIQILKALQRGMGSRVDEQLLQEVMQVIGTIPSDKVMSFCETDSLALRKVHDLILYARSLQVTDPPLWLLSGSWLMGVQYPEAMPIFILLTPHIAGGVAYLAFRSYRPGDFYSLIYDDPVPDDAAKWDSWIVRANAVMKDLKFDEDFQKRSARGEFSPVEAHYFFQDYLIHSDADSVNKEIYVSFVRNRSQQNDLQYTGRDSITVIFDEKHIVAPDGIITQLKATRDIGISMIAGTAFPKQSLTGAAYLMPIGEHDPEIANTYRNQLIDALQPEINVKVETAPAIP